MKKKTKHDISESDSQDEKDTSKSKSNSPKKNTKKQGNTSTKSALNGSQIPSKIDPDESEDDAILRDIGTNAETHKNSHNKSLGSEETIATFTVEDLSPDDEVYTFYCPDYCNKQEFCKKSIESLGSVLDKNHGNFQVEFLESEKKFITLAVPTNNKNGCLMNLPYKGHVVIQKSLEIPDENFNESEREFRIQFPDNLKVRHPLLGVEWESHLSLAEKAISNSHLIHKRNKKLEKAKRKRDSETESLKMNKSSDVLSSPAKKKKKL